MSVRTQSAVSETRNSSNRQPSSMRDPDMVKGITIEDRDRIPVNFMPFVERSVAENSGADDDRKSRSNLERVIKQRRKSGPHTPVSDQDEKRSAKFSRWIQNFLGCCRFCCPPCPGPIIRKCSFFPPDETTYRFVDKPEGKVFRKFFRFFFVWEFKYFRVTCQNNVSSLGHPAQNE